MEKEYHILSLSGGKDSTALAFFMKENMPEIFEKLELVFCDTECELPELYDYLNKIEVFLDKKIIRIKPPVSFDQIHSCYGFLPHPANRWCTVELKTKPFQKYLKENYSNGIINLYIGIRADESSRVDTATSKIKYIHEKFPFVENAINKKEVIQILNDSGIGLAGFYSWKRRSGCYFCFFQNKMDWISLYEHYPKLFEKAVSMEKYSEKIKQNGYFGWNYKMPISKMIEPETLNQIKEKYRKINKNNQEKVKLETKLLLVNSELF